MQDPKFKRVTFIVSSSLLAVFLIISLQFGWINQLLAQITQPSIGATKPPVQMNDYAQSLNNALTDVYDAVSPTIVSVLTTVDVSKNDSRYYGFEDWDRFFDFFDRRGGDYSPEKPDLRQSGGSGVIISKDGYIVTNCHVVENATEDGITITTWDKKEYPAKLIGKDSLTDLAVIKIEESNLTPAHFGNADSLKPGQIVVALGSPMRLRNTMTQGIISALGRESDAFPGIRRSAYSIENYIQTDAAINPGNSGGGLFNLNGSLIGINTLIATNNGGFQGYGFAIPIDIIENTVTDLISTGKVNRGYLGAAVVNLDDKFAKHLGLDKVKGVLIQDVNPDSPAEKAGIKTEDVILEINGKSIGSIADLRSVLAGHKVGEQVKVTLWRDKKTITKTVKLGAANGENLADNTSTGSKDDGSSSDQPVTFEKYGFTVEPLTKEQKKRFETTNGIYVKNVQSFSVAFDRRIRQGCAILKADRVDIKTTGQFQKIIDNKKQGETILLNLRSPDGTNFMAVLEIL